ncbi:hypothetical protein DIPPA_08162 [Diplonema papillatum]|nr:hypothetical protein DIPPA_02522 [Diplonema papillatum]KAJ9447111.1 hypothetical protein DIPPA_08162 [Diplonema papillatum]
MAVPAACASKQSGSDEDLCRYASHKTDIPQPLVEGNHNSAAPMYTFGISCSESVSAEHFAEFVV